MKVYNDTIHDLLAILKRTIISLRKLGEGDFSNRGSYQEMLDTILCMDVETNNVMIQFQKRIDKLTSEREK